MSLTSRLVGLMDVHDALPIAQPPRQLWGFIWYFVRQHRYIWGSIFGMSILSSASNTLGPYVLRHIVDTLLTVPTPAAAWPLLMPWLVVYIGVCLAFSIGVYLSMSFLRATTVNSGLTHIIRQQLHQNLLGQSWMFFQNDFAGRLATKIMDVGSEIRNITNSVRRFLWVFITFVTGAITLAVTQPLLVIPFGVWAVLYVSVIVYATPRIKRLARTFSDTRSAVVGGMVDSYSNIQTVKLFGGQGREKADMSDLMHKARMLHAGVQLANFKLDVVTLLLEMFLLSSLLLLSLWLWSHGLTTPGTIAMVLPLSIMMVNQASMVREEFGSFIESLGTLEDAMHTLVHPVAVADAPHALPLQVTRGQLAFRNVTFQYHPSHPPVMANLTLTIPAGQKVGLVGPSGAGKSTLVNLLLRFFDITSGTITVDAQDIREVTQDSLRAHIGVVTQDTALLHRSIAENIAYGKPGATQEEIEAAAQKAHAHSFILGLVDKDGRTGYAARVGERGVKLSGGQRQRIAIARLILKDAPILILDEATSALDSEVELAIQENLATLMEGKTVIAIAHRLSTISKLDRLLVLDKGEIVEDGSHTELLRQKGLYARLWAHQSGGFLPEE